MVSSALTLRRAKSTPGRRPFVGVGGHDRVQALRRGGEVAVLLDVAEQVHAEVVEAKVGDRDAGADVLEFDDFVLEPAELLLAERCVAAFEREHVVVGGAGEVGDDHAVLDALLEVDVLVQGDVGPEVHELDLRVGRADAVDAAESLDDPHRVPVDVVVDQVVAVLEVLALADDSRCRSARRARRSPSAW